MRLHTGPHGRVRAALPRASPALGPDPNPILLTLGLPIPLPPVQGLCAISQSALMGGGHFHCIPRRCQQHVGGIPNSDSVLSHCPAHLRACLRLSGMLPDTSRVDPGRPREPEAQQVASTHRPI